MRRERKAPNHPPAPPIAVTGDDFCRDGDRREVPAAAGGGRVSYAPLERGGTKLTGLLLAIVLLAVHAGLLVWSLIGLAEWLLPAVPWMPISNPELPRPVLLLQWLSVLAAAMVFVVGYGARWRGTPPGMAATYAVMAAVCALETTRYLTHASRWADMAGEYVTYAVILIVLFRHEHFRRRFGR